MSTQQYVHTSDKLPNPGDYVELKAPITAKPFLAVFKGVTPSGSPEFIECSSGKLIPPYSRDWRHFSERYAAVCALAEQGWWDSREAKPFLHQDIFVSDGVTVDPVRYEGDPSKGYLGLMGSCRLRFTENFYYWKPRTPEVTPPPPKVPKPAPVATGPVWHDGGVKAPSDGQYVWVNTGIHQLVCRYRQSDHLFVCVAGTEFGRGFYASICLWHTLIPPAAEPSLEANKAVWVNGKTTHPKHRQHVWVSIDSTVELCQWLSSDLQFEVLSGPDRSRRFSSALWWQAVLLPTARFDKLDNS